MEEYGLPVLLGVIFGFIGRLSLLRTDYRQYPTQPHGTIIHLTLGLIAAGLGAIAIPALFEQEYAAVTFLALAAQHFRDVRNMERETLSNIDEVELVERGKTYIEGIAMVFEGRNYLVIIVSFFTCLAALKGNWWIGVAVGVVGVIFAHLFKRGKKLDSIVEIQPAQVRIDGADVFVGDIHIMNVGLEQSLDIISKRALGIILVPKSMNSVVTISNQGQRQAILHDLSVGLGMYQDADTPSLVPLTRRDLDDGRVAIYFIPQIHDMDRALKVVSKVPILENAIRLPSESAANQKGGS